MWYHFPLTLPFILLGIFGGVCAVNRFFRDHAGHFVFEPFGALLYFSLFCMTGAIALHAYFVLCAAGSDFCLPVVALGPFAFAGHLAWFMAFMVDRLFHGLGPSNLPVAKTFDKGDGLMARGLYPEAEAQYRRDLAEEPLNTDALLRVCKAMEAAGRFKDAAEELSLAHQKTREARDEPPLEHRLRQERLLRLTLARGDILVHKLDQAGEAWKLYQLTLEILYGYPPADPLRDRLKALEETPNLRAAREQAQPERIKLE